MELELKFKNMSLPNTTIDPLKLAGYLKNLSKRKINNVILEASSHGLKQNRLDGLRFDKGILQIYPTIIWIIIKL